MNLNIYEEENREAEAGEFELLKLQLEMPVSRVPRDKITVTGDPYASMAKGPRDSPS